MGCRKVSIASNENSFEKSGVIGVEINCSCKKIKDQERKNGR